MKQLSVFHIFLLLIVFYFVLPFHGYAQDEEMNIISESAILMDAKSGQVIFGKNENAKMFPASITKIATAIYAIETSNLSDLVTVSENAWNVEGTRVYLEVGEEMTLEKLIIGMIVNSGNDAAVAIAEHIDGSLENFSKNINQYLTEKIGVENTHFTNPHGLYDEGHYTTAYDMAKITSYALQNEKFREIFAIVKYPWEGQSWDTTLLNHHRILKGEFPYEGVTGGKNGFVNESGFTLVTSAKRDHIELVAVTLKTNFKNVPYTDTINLLDYGFENYKTMKIDKESTFELDGLKFKATEDLYYTVETEKTISFHVNENGELFIVNEDEETIARFQLQSLQEKSEKVEETIANVDEVENPSNEYAFMISIIVSIAVLCIGFLYIKKQLRKD